MKERFSKKQEISKEVRSSFGSLKKNSSKWISIIINYKLSEELIEKYSKTIDWNLVSGYQVLSEEFIERNSDKIDWRELSEGQELSESFIERNKDKVSWLDISMSQELSEEFVWRNLDKIDLVGMFHKSKKYSNSLQKKILEELIGIEVIAGDLEIRYMSDYMRELYEKYRIMI